MRSARVFAVFLAVLLVVSLSACKSAPSGDVLDGIREELRGALAVNFTADIRADYGERVFDFSVTCAASGGTGTLTINSPEIIAGAKVLYSDGATTLSVGDAEIYTGEILPGGLSPVDAVPVMLDTWKNGLVTETVRERYGGEECIAAIFRIDDDVELRTWFSEATSLPARAEFIFDGYTVIAADFYDMEAE